MSVQTVASWGALALAVAWILRMRAAAKSKPWTAPLTADGQPDLQGNWVNRSATPLERPRQLEGRQSLTDEEVAELKRRADRLFKNGRSDAPAGDDVFL